MSKKASTEDGADDYSDLQDISEEINGNTETEDSSIDNVDDSWTGGVQG